jgi:uncharacterized SAM-binding protein YcdF (DUF218 family)
MTSTSISETKAAPRRRRRKLLLRTVVCCSATVLLWVTAGLFLFVAPTMDAPKHADVLLVLAPAGDRMRHAERLMDHGYAGTLAISVPLGYAGNPDSALCNEKRTYRIVCFSPDPVTTQGEARALKRLSREYGWQTANVLTMQSHVARARVILERCYKGDLSMVGYWQDLPLLSLKNPRRSWAYRYAYETAAFVKVALNTGC